MIDRSNLLETYRTSLKGIWDLFESPFNQNYFESYDFYSFEKDGTLVLSFDLPGVKEKDLSIEIDNNDLLIISAERKTLDSVKRITKKQKISSLYDTKNVKAVLENGVLTVSFSLKDKQETSEKRKVLLQK